MSHGPLNSGQLRRRLSEGEVTVGTFVGLSSATATEVCAASGADWVLIDLEHGAGGEDAVRDGVIAAGSYGVPTIVRVESGDRIRIGRVLDQGAAGIMVPG
jgi:4-hydroxy-2-oxoheptanedioate aldolase